MHRHQQTADSILHFQPLLLSVFLLGSCNMVLNASYWATRAGCLLFTMGMFAGILQLVDIRDPFHDETSQYNQVASHTNPRSNPKNDSYHPYPSHSLSASSFHRYLSVILSLTAPPNHFPTPQHLTDSHTATSQPLSRHPATSQPLSHPATSETRYAARCRCCKLGLTTESRLSSR